MKSRKDNIEMVPPDGGWGWLIVIGSILINFSTKALGPSFGLIFGDFFAQHGIETTGASFVSSSMDAVFNITGLFVGPLFKKYTFRKLAITGGLISSAAVLLTVPANSMVHILLTFGVMGGIGFGLANSCTLVGINDYFSEKKGLAVGISMTGAGAGFMLMPQIVRFLLDEYDFRSTLLILGALCLHTVVGATLFQPVSWHKIAQVIEPEGNTFLPPDKFEKKDLLPGTIDNKDGTSSPHIEARKALFNNIPSEAFFRKGSLISNISLLDDARNTIPIQGITEKAPEKDIESYRGKKRSIKSCWSWFSKILDLDLLKDGEHLNIIYASSMFFVVTMNFKFILPFFLTNHGFTRRQVALSLSAMGAADICARLIIPPIVDRIRCCWRTVFMFSLIFTSLIIFWLTLETNVTPILIVLIITGFFQGISLTSFPLVLAEYASQDNFPSVLGLSMVFRGLTMALLGPLIGYMRDVFNSYRACIYFQIVLTSTAVIAWAMEKLILKYRYNKEATMDVSLIEIDPKLLINKV